jgi:hypothetical protein
VPGAREVRLRCTGWTGPVNTNAGNMPHLMPSGQDFFTQLKKQLTSLDPGKPS